MNYDVMRTGRKKRQRHIVHRFRDNMGMWSVMHYRNKITNIHPPFRFQARLINPMNHRHFPERIHFIPERINRNHRIIRRVFTLLVKNGSHSTKYSIIQKHEKNVSMTFEKSIAKDRVPPSYQTQLKQSYWLLCSSWTLLIGESDTGTTRLRFQCKNLTTS